MKLWKIFRKWKKQKSDLNISSGPHGSKNFNFEGVILFLGPKIFWRYPILGFLILKSNQKPKLVLNFDSQAPGPKSTTLRGSKYFFFIKNVTKLAIFQHSNFVIFWMIKIILWYFQGSKILKWGSSDIFWYGAKKYFDTLKVEFFGQGACELELKFFLLKILKRGTPKLFWAPKVFWPPQSWNFLGQEAINWYGGPISVFSIFWKIL